ncbi:MAG: MalY/PatB family protein [Propionibacteriaceae bacterium]
MESTIANPLEQLSLAELRRRTSVKWRAYPDDVLPLWVAEMDTVLAEPVDRALRDALDRGDTGYCASSAPYAEALAGFARQQWGWEGPVPGRTAIVPDVMLGVVEMLRLLTGPGESVIINAPVYPPFHAFVTTMGRRIVEAPLGPDRRIDLDALSDRFEDATRGGVGRAAFLLCNPHNPTGTVHTRAELTAVAELAHQHGVRVVADEIHAPLVHAGAEFVPYLSVPGGESGLSLMSASKGWNLAGLKAALVVAGEEAAPDLARLPEEVGHGASHLAAIAHTAALRDGGAWLDALLAGLDEKRRLLADLLAAELPEVPYTPPEATFLAWLDCRGLGVPEGGAAEPGLVTLMAGPAAAFLAECRVAVSAGPAFGSGGAGHVRLNFATSTEILTEAIQRMGRVTRNSAR